MDAIKEYLRIADRLEHEEITPLEYEELCEPLRNVVEVVRCKDCKWLKPDGKCKAFADYQIRPSASDYCSYGERREEDDIH